MKQEGEVKYCNISKNVFLKHFEHNYSYIKEKLSLLDILDPDAIHDIRVTTRRNRALFTEFKHFIPDEIRKRYINENKNITKLLGKRRELDVLLKLFSSIREENPKVFTPHISETITIYIIEERKKEEKNCLIARQMLEKRISELDTNFNLQIPKEQCIYKHGKKEIFLTIKKLQKEYKLIKNIEDPLNEEIHQFRILLKKARYKFEIYKDIYSNPISEWLNVLKEVQNHLGIWNDYRILLITIKNLYKKNKKMNYYEFFGIENYLYNILNTELRKAKKIKEETINNKFIKLTENNINEMFKSHTCLL